MAKETTFKLYGLKSCVEAVIQKIEGVAIDISELRPIGAGTAPLNAPVDPETIKEFTVAITILLTSTAGVLICAEKILDIAIRLKTKFKILISAKSDPIIIEPNTSLKEITQLIERSLENEE